jgi:hypothetical protein
MTGFTRKIPADYQFPYKNMLHDITEQIKAYTKHRGISPNFIIIHSEDKGSLMEEMISFKLILGEKPVGKLQFQGIRIIESPDLIKGFFEVVGN